MEGDRESAAEMKKEIVGASMIPKPLGSFLSSAIEDNDTVLSCNILLPSIIACALGKVGNKLVVILNEKDIEVLG